MLNKLHRKLSPQNLRHEKGERTNGKNWWTKNKKKFVDNCLIELNWIEMLCAHSAGGCKIVYSPECLCKVSTFFSFYLYLLFKKKLYLEFLVSR